MRGEEIFYDYGEHHVVYSPKNNRFCTSCDDKRMLGSNQPYIIPEQDKRNKYMQMQDTSSYAREVRPLSALEIRRNATMQSFFPSIGKLRAYIIDIASGTRLVGAKFEVCSDDGTVKTIMTDDEGKAYLVVNSGKKCTLQAVDVPQGYSYDSSVHSITCSLNGQIRVNGKAINQLIIPATKVEPLAAEPSAIIENPEAFYPQVRENQELVAYTEDDSEREEAQEHITPEESIDNASEEEQIEQSATGFAQAVHEPAEEEFEAIGSAIDYEQPALAASDEEEHFSLADGTEAVQGSDADEAMLLEPPAPFHNPYMSYELSESDEGQIDLAFEAEHGQGALSESIGDDLQEPT
ncbi:MAG: hypothetical protein FWG30_00790 [Eubacteriaceae bacterium]|nr:hypothetical protein [Eubacteriaceae bacterium]